MWPFKRTLSETVAVGQLITMCSSLQARVSVLEADLTKVQAQQESLRGRFYAAKLHKEQTAAAAPAPKSREEVLRERFTPGQPARHSS